MDYKKDSVTDYRVRLEVFEGPLDLLLHLVKKNELDIFNIPIAEITADYLNYIKLFRKLNLNFAGEFLVMASTLIHIKSRMLLPSVETVEEEEIEDPRAELAARIMEYKKFKEAASILKEKEAIQRDVYGRLPLVPQDEDYTLEATLFDLMDAFQKVVFRAEKEVREIIQEDIRVEDRIQEILSLLENKRFINFETIFSGQRTKRLLIVTFLALLELIRLRTVFARQARPFGDIRIYKGKREVVS
ncbi:MAG: segregation/condensation protein A [Elusimicrobiota bacterium]|nr:segregation/condensation protein A [Elusimicrobiota bacterium]